MPLSLEAYTDELAGRKDLIWPKPPKAEPANARPGIRHLPEVRCVLWNVYGTFLNIFQGEILFEHPKEIVMSFALEKTIQEFNMWTSMSRRPGLPSVQMKVLYDQVIAFDMVGIGSVSGEKYPERPAEKIWEILIKNKLKSDYHFDVSKYGQLPDYAKKIAYFFHASLQGTCPHEGAVEAIRSISDLGLRQGILTDGQCFTWAQVRRGILEENPTLDPDLFFDRKLRIISSDVGAKKPSERIFKRAKEALASTGLQPSQVLFVSNKLEKDLGPAKKMGMRTALFVGDKSTLQARPEQLKDPHMNPDLLLTRLDELHLAFAG